MYLKHLSSLQFLSYVAFFAVVIAALWKVLPARAPPCRTEPYPDEELGAHDRKLAKYFVAGGGFLVVGSVQMVLKNLPWAAEWLARAGYAGHLVRDLSNTHVMIVGGGTLLATGLCWYTLPRVVGRPLASEGLAQCAFWLTAAGLAIFYVALVGNGIAIGRLVEHGRDYEVAKASMGGWYKLPVGIGAGIMGLGYWCFAANVLLTVFHSRLVRIAKPSGHLWKFFAVGVGGLTVGTVQGVIQVQPGNERWLHSSGHAGEWIDPISHAHINLVTGLTMLVAGAAFFLAPRTGGQAPSRRLANACFWSLLTGSLAFYGAALYLGFHEGRLVVKRGFTPEQAEAATALHPYLIVGAGVSMFAAFWFLLWTLARAYRNAGAFGIFVLAGCASLAVGTLQGPIQVVPSVHELLHRGGEAGEVIVNLHAQVNMLGGLMAILVGLVFAVLSEQTTRRLRPARVALIGIAGGVMLYYVVGLVVSAVEAGEVAAGHSFTVAVAELEPWASLLAVPAAAMILLGFGAYAVGAWTMTTRQRREARDAVRAAPAMYAGRIPKRVRRRSPASVAAYELPMGMLGFPGVGWLFAGFPITAAFLLLSGPVLAWALLPMMFSPFGDGPLRGVGWKLEFAWLPASALVSATALYVAHARRRRRLEGKPPRRRGRDGRRRRDGYKTRVSVAIGSIALLLVSLPFVPAVAGLGSGSVRYTYQRFTKEVRGQFLVTTGGSVKLFSWTKPQAPYPSDALRVRGTNIKRLLVRAAVVDAPSAYRLYDLDRGRRVSLAVAARSARSLALAPARTLLPGRYAFVGTHEGMFGGKDFSYLTVVRAHTRPTSIGAADSNRGSPAVARTLLPVATSLLAALFAVVLFLSFRRRPAGQKLLWGAGFALFAIASAVEALAERHGWSPGLFQTYYLAGGVLTVAYLGAGSAWLLLPRPGRDVLLGALAVATVAAATSVALAPVDHTLLAAAGHGRPPDNDALEGHAYLWAIALNSLGTLMLLGGSLLSLARRRRMAANAWIAVGALAVAAATGMSRTGTYSFVYIGELVGIACMFYGFTFAGSVPKPAAKKAIAARAG